MNCFQHPRQAAVGHCAYCGRGLCGECATVAKGKLSCRGNCQEEIARERRLLERSESALEERSVVFETSGSVYQRSSAFSAFFGLAFVALGMLLLLSETIFFGAVLLGLGVVFITNGIGFARAGNKFKTMAAQGRNEGPKS